MPNPFIMSMACLFCPQCPLPRIEYNNQSLTHIFAFSLLFPARLPPFCPAQFIEETVFTCPFTGIQRDILLERNMFPYDVPTDVEHWTLWSRKDLSQTEMEEFVQKWVAENHPHVVDWECDNNEGDRSIDWYHVHVFFRVGCQDKSGTPRDPASMYDGPCGTPPMAATSNGLFVDEEVTVTS